MISTIQSAPIDVTNWIEDEIYFNYPEGARSKLAFFPPAEGTPEFINKKRRYLYKRSDKRYPDQFWGEVVAYQVGGLLGVDVPPAYVAVNGGKDGDCAALIEWFYEDAKAQFIPGGQYMQRMMPDFDRKRGLQHNFQTIRTLGRALTLFQGMTERWEERWTDAFLFDALIGNTDRHQDNWGYLFTRRKKGDPVVTFAPLFDNGTSLGHERFPSRLAAWSEDDFLRYIRKGTHHIRWDKADLSSCGHVDLLKKMVEVFPNVEEHLRKKIEGFDTALLVPILDKLADLEMPVPLTQDRKNLYIKLIEVRHTTIRAAFR